MTDQTRASVAMQVGGAANDDFKRSFSAWFWGSMTAATVVHFLAFAFWPTMSVADVSLDSGATPIIEIPDKHDLPEAPEPINQPAMPVISDLIDEDITIPSVDFADNPPGTLPPPPEQVDTGIPDAPYWTAVDVYPYIKNRDELTRALEHEYPPLLRDAGIGGTTKVWFRIDENGKVVRTQVHTSSGHKPLDDAALKVAHLYEFSPAMNRDKPVAVWVSLDITFRPR